MADQRNSASHPLYLQAVEWLLGASQLMVHDDFSEMLSLSPLRTHCVSKLLIFMLLSRSFPHKDLLPDLSVLAGDLSHYK